MSGDSPFSVAHFLVQVHRGYRCTELIGVNCEFMLHRCSGITDALTGIIGASGFYTASDDSNSDH